MNWILCCVALVLIASNAAAEIVSRPAHPALHDSVRVPGEHIVLLVEHHFDVGAVRWVERRAEQWFVLLHSGIVELREGASLERKRFLRPPAPANSIQSCDDGIVLGLADGRVVRHDAQNGSWVTMDSFDGRILWATSRDERTYVVWDRAVEDPGSRWMRRELLLTVRGVGVDLQRTLRRDSWFADDQTWSGVFEGDRFLWIRAPQGDIAARVDLKSLQISDLVQPGLPVLGLRAIAADRIVAYGGPLEASERLSFVAEPVFGGWRHWFEGAPERGGEPVRSPASSVGPSQTDAWSQPVSAIAASASRDRVFAILGEGLYSLDRNGRFDRLFEVPIDPEPCSDVWPPAIRSAIHLETLNDAEQFLVATIERGLVLVGRDRHPRTLVESSQRLQIRPDRILVRGNTVLLSRPERECLSLGPGEIARNADGWWVSDQTGSAIENSVETASNGQPKFSLALDLRGRVFEIAVREPQFEELLGLDRHLVDFLFRTRGQREWESAVIGLDTHSRRFRENDYRIILLMSGTLDVDLARIAPGSDHPSIGISKLGRRYWNWLVDAPGSVLLVEDRRARCDLARAIHSPQGWFVSLADEGDESSRSSTLTVDSGTDSHALDGDETEQCWSDAARRDGHYLLIRGKELIEWHDAETRPRSSTLPPPPDASMRQVAVAGNGDVWIAGDRLHLRAAGTNSWSAIELPAVMGREIEDMAADPQDSAAIWIAAARRGALRVARGQR